MVGRKPEEYYQYFEDSAKGCADRLENRHSVLNRVSNAEIGPEGKY